MRLFHVALMNGHAIDSPPAAHAHCTEGGAPHLRPCLQSIRRTLKPRRAAARCAQVGISQYLANFFVDQARASAHSFGSVAEEKASLIYSKAPVTWYAPSFMQTYVWGSHAAEA